MFPTGPTGVRSEPPRTNPAGRSIRINLAHHAAQPDGERDQSATPGNQPKSGKGMASLLSKATKGIKRVLSKCVPPTEGGAAFIEKEKRDNEIAYMLDADAPAWHKYEKLDSDAESDKPSPQKSTTGQKIKKVLKKISLDDDNLMISRAMLGAMQ
ncbi:hypothetical protein F5Y10DRAFT_261032 [Nemania abortiva]|nr:hypothetical protein F5Y10DRAFT_261032 [Nemania abortiva]